MAAIERMERAKLCQMTRPTHYNHQTWRNGRNEVRYAPASEAAALQKAVEGYQLFIKLAEQYADEVIRLTRRERDRRKRPGKPKPQNHRIQHNYMLLPCSNPRVT